MTNDIAPDVIREVIMSQMRMRLRTRRRIAAAISQASKKKGRAVNRPWCFVAGHIMFQASSDAIRAKQETPLFLHQVAESQRRAADKRKADAP